MLAVMGRAGLEEGKGGDEAEEVMEAGTELKGDVAKEKEDSLKEDLAAGTEERRVREGTTVGLAGSCDHAEEEGSHVVGRPPLDERGRRHGDGSLLDDEVGATSYDVRGTVLRLPFTGDATSRGGLSRAGGSEGEDEP